MRRGTRFFPVLVAVVVSVLGAATPAWAHEEIRPDTFRAKTPTFLTISAADEQKVELVGLVLTAPHGVPLGSTTKEPAGWVAEKSASVITWTAQAGVLVKPDHFEQWGFETDGADQPGTFSFKVTLRFADSTSQDVEVPVTVVGGGTPAVGASTTISATPIASKGGQSRANAGIIIGIIALVVAVVALGVVARRRESPAATARPAGAAQDW